MILEKIQVPGKFELNPGVFIYMGSLKTTDELEYSWIDLHHSVNSLSRITVWKKKLVEVKMYNVTTHGSGDMYMSDRWMPYVKSIFIKK